MYCEKCGNKLNEKDKFCDRCGAPAMESADAFGLSERKRSKRWTKAVFAVGGCLLAVSGLSIFLFCSKTDFLLDSSQETSQKQTESEVMEKLENTPLIRQTENDGKTDHESEREETQLKKQEKSEKVSVDIKKKPDTESVTDDHIEAVNSAAPFYGIWIGASKDPTEADRIAQKMNSSGREAYVIVTTDWSNLNSEKWYVVTAGMYLTKEDANAQLADIQACGYADAYIKYSGEPR